MSNDHDGIETSAPVPEFFKKFHVKVIHQLAVDRAKKALQDGLAALSSDQLEGDGAEQTWAQQSLQAKLHDLDRPYDD